MVGDDVLDGGGTAPNAHLFVKNLLYTNKRSCGNKRRAAAWCYLRNVQVE